MGWSRARLGLLALAGVIAIGTAWYSLVESFTALDALYQAVTTVSTVGFREVNPLDSSGRIFTIGLIFVGVGAMFFTVTAVFEAILEDQVGRIGRRRMQRRIDDLDDHVVVCGYGRVGRTVVPLVADAMGVVVIELDEDRGKAAAEAGFPVIVGDATDDAVLEEAGLSRAKVLVSALPTDADNLYVVLSGRAARADLHIVARARSESSEAKLQLAGADRVINPQEIGGRRMAAFALQPAVSEFLDVVVHGAGEVAYRLEEIEVPAQAALAGCSIRDAHIRDQTGALVLALRDGAEHFVTNPGPDTLLGPGMTIIAIGTDDQLQRLRAYVAAGRTASDPSTVDARATRE